MFTTSNRPGPTGDLGAILQQAMAVGATAPASAPVLSIVLPGGDSLTIQEGGDIAIYRPVGFDYHLFACGCMGEVVNEIPRAADCVLMFNLLGAIHRIYRYGDTYYDFPGIGDKFIQFKAYITPAVGQNNADQTCASSHNYPALIPREYREITEKDDLVKDQRKPRDRDRT